MPFTRIFSLLISCSFGLFGIGSYLLIRMSILHLAQSVGMRLVHSSAIPPIETPFTTVGPGVEAMWKMSRQIRHCFHRVRQSMVVLEAPARKPQYAQHEAPERRVACYPGFVDKKAQHIPPSSLDQPESPS